MQARHGQGLWDATDSWVCTAKNGFPQVYDSRRAEFATSRLSGTIATFGGKPARAPEATAAADQLCNDLLEKISN